MNTDEQLWSDGVLSMTWHKTVTKVCTSHNGYRTTLAARSLMPPHSPTLRAIHIDSSTLALRGRIRLLLVTLRGRHQPLVLRTRVLGCLNNGRVAAGGDTEEGLHWIPLDRLDGANPQNRTET